MSAATLAYVTWRDAVAKGNEDLAAMARADLLVWLDSGVEPAWTKAQEIAFLLVLP